MRALILQHDFEVDWLIRESLVSGKTRSHERTGILATAKSINLLAPRLHTPSDNFKHNSSIWVKIWIFHKEFPYITHHMIL